MKNYKIEFIEEDFMPSLLLLVKSEVELGDYYIDMLANKFGLELYEDYYIEELDELSYLTQKGIIQMYDPAKQFCQHEFICLDLEDLLNEEAA